MLLREHIRNIKFTMFSKADEMYCAVAQASMHAEKIKHLVIGFKTV